MFENGKWYQGAITAVDYVTSQRKQTPALELTVDVPEHGLIAGQWWLVASLVKHPDGSGRMVSMAEAAMQRCVLFGCDAAALRKDGWLAHARSIMIGQAAAVKAEVNSYGDTKAAFIGKPKGKAKGFVRQDNTASPFGSALSSQAPDPWGATDDDVPF